MPIEAFERWRLPLLLAAIGLLPFGVAAELPLLIGAFLGLVLLLRGRLSWASPTVQLAVLLGLAYWLPQFISAWDSFSPGKSWREVALDLRFILFLLFVAQAPIGRRQAGWLVCGIALIAGFWCLDALLQAVTGFSLGGAATSDRLSGIFGAGNLKLGGVLAVLSPFALLAAWRWRGLPALASATACLLLVILLAGARAAWVVFGLAVVLVYWQALGRRRALCALLVLGLAGTAVGAGSYLVSERFAQRVDRTAQALAVDTAGIDHALSGRLHIWRTALRMGQAHPINGVGVRAFRQAYPEHAAAEDPFVEGDTGAFHAHQIVLELWSETGLAGVLIWLLAVVLVLRRVRLLPSTSRQQAWPASVALMVTLFPLNTHYAFYSGFWGLLLVWLLAVWLLLLRSGEDAAAS